MLDITALADYKKVFLVIGIISLILMILETIIVLVMINSKQKKKKIVWTIILLKVAFIILFWIAYSNQKILAWLLNIK